MALPSSGLISLNQVNVELKNTDTAVISLGDAAVMALAKITSGPISMSDLYGKSSEVRYINTTNRTAANIHTLMGKPTVANIYIFENTAQIAAASKGSWALQTGTFPAGSTLTIINRGAIRGGGGNGGSGTNASAGGAGGSALVLNFPVSIDNTSGTIYGGGGGGGGGAFSGGGGGGGIPAGSGGGGTKSGKAGSAVNGGSGAGSGSIMGGAGGSVGNAGGKGKSNGGPEGKGGRGGYSVQRNGNAVTWIAVGDRKGSVV